MLHIKMAYPENKKDNNKKYIVIYNIINIKISKKRQEKKKQPKAKQKT